MVGILFLEAAGPARADLKDHVGIIRPELNEKTKGMFQDLSDYFKSKGQQGEASYLANWAQGGLQLHHHQPARSSAGRADRLLAGAAGWLHEVLR